MRCGHGCNTTKYTHALEAVARHGNHGRQVNNLNNSLSKELPKHYLHFDDLARLVQLLKDCLLVLVVYFDQIGQYVKLDVSEEQ